MIIDNCDEVQQKVHQVRKLVFPNASKLVEETITNIKKKSIQLIHAKSSYEILNL